MVHFAFASAGFFNPHSPHVHSAAEPFDVGAFRPTAPQLKLVALGAEAAVAPGLGASQIVHFSVAVEGFFSEHWLQFHSPSAGPVVGSTPAAPQLNEGAGWGGSVAVPGLGASQIVHLTIAPAGFWSEH